MWQPDMVGKWQCQLVSMTTLALLRKSTESNISAIAGQGEFHRSSASVSVFKHWVRNINEILFGGVIACSWQAAVSMTTRCWSLGNRHLWPATCVEMSLLLSESSRLQKSVHFLERLGHISPNRKSNQRYLRRGFNLKMSPNQALAVWRDRAGVNPSETLALLGQGKLSSLDQENILRIPCPEASCPFHCDGQTGGC